MTLLLDKFRAAGSAFTPRTTRDIFALRLAQKLDDAAAAPHYATLASEYSESQLLLAYRRTLRNAVSSDRARRFHAELSHTNDHGSDSRTYLLAVRIERRSIAAAVFYGIHIEYTQVRQLASRKDKALGSAVSFVNWLLTSFPIEGVALEELPGSDEIQRRLLTDVITRTVRERMLPIWEIPKAQLFEACGHPPLKSRKELREVVARIWPVLAGTNGHTFIRDAAALGLFVQTERLFIIN